MDRDGACDPRGISQQWWISAPDGKPVYGLIVIAMGVQFALTGLHDFFSARPDQG